MLKILAANSSQSVCDLLGCNTVNTGTLQANEGLNGQVANIIKYGLGLVFAAIIVFGIFLTIRAAITIINSNGNEGKVEEGAKVIKGIFIGIGIIFAGIIGIIILLAFFQAGGLLSTKVDVPNNVQIPIVNQ